MKPPALIHPQLLAAQLMYEACGYAYTAPLAETERADYCACTFKINSPTVKYRAARTRPKKTGQFVTLWKRHGQGPIQPFDVADGIDLFIISMQSGPQAGQFVFPAAVLHR